jgi:PIN domain nuclease of toxin-antitoxin system
MALVLDTHAVIWYLSGSSERSLTARNAIETEERNGDNVFVSAISLVEVIYLAEKGRLPSVALQRLQDALKDPAGSMIVAPLDAEVAGVVQQISRSKVPDMPDRIIAATALRLNAGLVTRDHRLQSAGIRVVW